MKKQRVLLNKALVIGILVLFIGMSVVSSAGYNATVSNLSGINTKMDSATVLLDENFSGTFPPEGWSTDCWTQSNISCCYSEPPCAYLPAYNPGEYDGVITSKAVDASDYEIVYLKFKIAIWNNHCSFYFAYRMNESSPWKIIAPWDNPLTEDVCTWLEFKINCSPGNCGEALQMKWTVVSPYNYGWDACIDDVKILWKHQYEQHDPIYIHGDDDFTSENGVTGGSGTSNDPYIIEDWKISATSQDGIVIRNTTVFFEIRDCYVHGGGTSYDGIVFYNVTNGIIKNNILTENRNGTVFRSQGYGMKENSSYNKIQENIISNNAFDGIHFEHTTAYYHKHSYNQIFLNNITGNNRGIYLIMSKENLIYNNNLIANSEFGVELFTCTGGGGDNRVYHNNFINNGGENGQASCTLDYNDWDDGYPSGGNYWSDYEGEDKYSGPGQNIPGSDGIGDEPYMIFSYYENDYDWYPLMEPYGNVSLPPHTTISFDPPYPDGENGWYVSDVTVTLEAEDDTGVDATFYRINEGEWEQYESPFILSEDGEDILIEYFSVDIDDNVEKMKSATLDIDQTPPEVIIEYTATKTGWREWLVSFNITVIDNTSGCGGMDRIEIFLNGVLQGTIVGSGPIYTWSFKFSNGLSIAVGAGAWDKAGNYGYNETKISLNRNRIRHSIHLIFSRFLDRFPILEVLLRAMNLLR